MIYSCALLPFWGVQKRKTCFVGWDCSRRFLRCRAPRAPRGLQSRTQEEGGRTLYASSRARTSRPVSERLRRFVVFTRRGGLLSVNRRRESHRPSRAASPHVADRRVCPGGGAFTIWRDHTLDTCFNIQVAVLLVLLLLLSRGHVRIRALQVLRPGGGGRVMSAVMMSTTAPATVRVGRRLLVAPATSEARQGEGIRLLQLLVWVDSGGGCSLLGGGGTILLLLLARHPERRDLFDAALLPFLQVATRFDRECEGAAL